MCDMLETKQLNVPEWRWCLIAMILPICAALVTWPFANLAFNDDFSYAHIALRFAQSGTIQYNGWSESMALSQSIYGGMLIRLFGFSFNLLRLATILVGSGCSALIYLLCRRAELSPAISLFVSITITISPLFLPFATSFMTDVYGCFFLLLCILFGIYAIDSVQPASASLWLVASIVIGLIGGADRPNCWVGPFAVLACFLWQKRQHRLLLFLGVLLAILSMLAIERTVQWYVHQPSAYLVMPAGHNIQNLAYLPRFSLYYLLSAILFSLPSLLLFIPSLNQSIAKWAGLNMGLALLLMGIALRHRTFLAPWLINTVTVSGIFFGELVGEKPVVLGTPIRAVVTAVTVFVSLVLIQLVITRALRLHANETSAFLFQSPRLRRFLVVLTFSLLGCLGLVALRGLTGSIWDDYLLPWLPIFLILVVRVLWRPGIKLHWRLGGSALLVFAVYGIAATHDYYAESRARVQATERLEAAGIARRNVNGGFELDAWTQLMAAGHICRTDAQPPSGGSTCPRGWTPMVDPHYYLAFSSVPGLVSSQFAPVSYFSWLPPFRRQVLILTHEISRGY